MRINQDYYLIVDLEATCAVDGSIVPMEIIEIGAVLLNSRSLKVEGEFQVFVKPVLHPNLTEFCKSLTSISQADVNGAPLFPEALESFKQWFYPYHSYLFCSWGNYDKNQFIQDCDLHKVAYPFLTDEHLNIRKAFSEAMGTDHKFGMDEALERLGIKLEGVHHRGIDDAKNIARIVKTLN